MNIETLKMANAINSEIQQLRKMQDEVDSGAFIKRTGHCITDDIIDAGKDAMKATIEDAVAELQLKLEEL